MRSQLFFVLASVADRAGYAILLAALAYSVGIGVESDIFFAVAALPSVLIFTVIDAAGIVLLRAMGAQPGPMARRGHGFAVITVVAAAGILLAVLADPLLLLIAPGLQGEAHDHAVTLQRWSAVLVPLSGLGAVFASIITGAGGAVWVAPLRGALSSALACLFAVAALFCGWGRVDMFVTMQILAAGLATLGLGAALFWQKIPVGGMFALPDRRVWAEVISGLLNLGGSNLAPNLVVLVERSLASLLGGGVLAAVSLARSVSVLVGTLPSSAATGSFTLFLARGEDRDTPLGIARTCHDMMRISVLVLIPILAVFLSDTGEIIAVLFQRGKFTQVETAKLLDLSVFFAISSVLFVLSVPLVRTLQLCRADRISLIITWMGLVVYTVLAISMGGNSAAALVMSHVAAQTLIVASLGFFVIRQAGLGVMALPYGRLALVVAATVTALAGLQLLPLPMGLWGIVVHGVVVVACAGAVAKWLKLIP